MKLTEDSGVSMNSLIAVGCAVLTSILVLMEAYSFDGALPGEATSLVHLYVACE